MNVLVHSRSDGKTICPYCRDTTGARDIECGCGVVYHDECRAALSRCATIGCKATRALDPTSRPPDEAPRGRSVRDYERVAMIGFAIIGAFFGWILLAIATDPDMRILSWSDVKGAVGGAILGVAVSWLLLVSRNDD